MGNRPMKQRTERVRNLIVQILQEADTPLTPKIIAHKVDSTTNMRCSVYRVGLALRPLVLKGDIIKTPIVGTHKFTYELI